MQVKIVGGAVGAATTLIIIHQLFHPSGNVGGGGGGSGGELFLTPMIRAGELKKARAESEDNMNLLHRNFQKPVKSYSGYLTIDNKTNSNLFFWFFPAQEYPEIAPVILWINEMPGHTALKGIFLENGPFMIDETGDLQERPHTWTKTHSMLYIDAPVGSGFSFADDKSAYANNSDDEAVELHEALTQFFTLFDDFKDQDFYMAGEAYAGAFIPHIAKKIDMENSKPGALEINLKGFVVGSPYFDFESSIKGYVDFYYDHGLVDRKQQKVLEEQVTKGLELKNQGKFDEAFELMVSSFYHPQSILANFTGFTDVKSVLMDSPPAELDRFINFLDSEEVHKYLHVGLHKFVEVNYEVFAKFGAEMFESHTGLLEELLDKGYRVLFYAPQFDFTFHAKLVREELAKLKWKGAEDFVKAPRRIWRYNGAVAGYTKSSRNLAYALVRNAGNYAMLDQPEWVMDLVEKFIYEKDLTDVFD